MPFIASAAGFVQPSSVSLRASRTLFASTFCARRPGLQPRRPRHASSIRTRPSPTCTTAASNGTNVIDALDVQPASLTATTSNLDKQRRPMTRFFLLLLSQWRLLFPALACAVIASVCGAVEPVLFGRVVAVVASAHEHVTADVRRRLLRRVFDISVTYVTEMITAYVFVGLAARAVDRAMRQLRETVFKAAMQNDVAFFDYTGRANIERTASIQLKIVRQAFWDNLSEDRGLRAALEAVFGICLVVKLVGLAGLPLFCVVVPILATFVAQFGIRLGRLGARVENKEADILSYFNERMRGLRTLKAFGAERKESGDLKALLDDAENTSTSFINTRSLTEWANRFNIYVCIILFFILGGYAVSAGAMIFQTFSSLVGFVWVLNFAVHGLQYTLTDSAKASVALGKVYAILDDAEAYRVEHEAQNCPPVPLPSSFKGHVRFEGVSFHYPSRPDTKVLADVALEIQPGQVIALVGDSGGGKSTIAALLSRFYAPTSGTVTLDGIDIQCLPSDLYARQLSVVDQEPFLFQGTIRDNIAYGLPDEVVTDKQIMRAATEANAHEFIVRLRDGYDTVWHPGSNLSGGQRQRIAIARSLVKAPRILVLDEATSALDQESERMVQTALERIMKKRTTLIIAHRLSTVRSANQILFVKGGEILERGTFDELINKPDGNFRALVKSSSALMPQSVE